MSKPVEKMLKTLTERWKASLKKAKRILILGILNEVLGDEGPRMIDLHFLFTGEELRGMNSKTLKVNCEKLEKQKRSTVSSNTR